MLPSSHCYTPASNMLTVVLHFNRVYLVEKHTLPLGGVVGHPGNLWGEIESTMLRKLASLALSLTTRHVSTVTLLLPVATSCTLGGVHGQGLRVRLPAAR